MQTRLKVQLAAFMFLQYFIWGSWYDSMGAYLATSLKFDGRQIGAAYGAFAVGSMISPFFVGLVADRYFASERILGVLGLLGGAVICLVPRAEAFGEFYPLLILYCATFAPTLALGNSLALHHLADPKRDFPRVKSFSAVGWIGGGVTVSLLGADTTANQFYLAGGLSVAFGLFALTLPHTPPKKVGADVSVGEILGLDALALLRKRSFAVFIGCMFLICIPLYFYFVNLGVYLTELGWPNATARMTLAQVSDVVFMLLLPVMLWRFGYKTTIAVGILAWAARYFLLAQSVDAPAATQAALIFAAILLHGVCYDFLFIAGQLYVDDEANERMRGAAQGFIAFILWGVGAFVGTLLAGLVMAAHELPVKSGTIEHDWAGIWAQPAIGAVAVLGVFLLFFREPRRATTASARDALPPGEGTP
ncbi:MAG TPA: MFS transporter [Urbifossiella sp.]|nr:MFS transporter [Urbifossiella sp.]